MTAAGITKSNRGQMAFHAGLAAEDSARRAYSDNGFTFVAARWRGRGGELDLVFRQADVFVFVEVKKSRSFAAAALRITPAQKARIFAAAEEFVSRLPSGLLTEMRFDAALVDATGRVEILENALWDG